ncbi:MAG: type III-A CRISPR-associated RAMP protein Csm5 [Bacteroidota bacterium]
MANATLTALTPVHVGNGQKLFRNFDFIVEENRVGFVDIERVASLIGNDPQSILQLTNAIEKKQPILEFLTKGRGIKNVTLEQICFKILKLEGYSEINTSELKEQYYTAVKGPCIPGSSLKGALRTGILKYLTSENRNTTDQQHQLINKIEWGARPDQVFKTLEKELFGNDANSKTTRFLTIGDIQFENLKTEVQELSYENLRNDVTKDWEFEQRKAQLVECIPADSSTSFQFKIDLELAATYTAFRNRAIQAERNVRMEPLRDLTVYGKGEIDFLKNINEATISSLTYDYNKLDGMMMNETYLEKLDYILTTAEQCRDGEAVVRVGGHSGWNFITNRWMIYNEEVLPDSMYDRLRAKAQKTDKYLHMKMFPKTRKLTQSATPLGFIKIILQA